MRFLCTSTLLAAVAVGSVQTAKFSVDGVTRTPSTIVATIQPRTAASGYSWLRVYFYSSSLPASERANAASGRVASIRTRWTAVLQFTVDKNSTVWQIDLSLPGHTCTIAESDRDARNALQEFQYEGGRLRVRGKGFHVCDMASLGIPNQRFDWDVDFETPVIEGGASPR